MARLPVFLKRYFWYVDFSTVDLKKSVKDVIARVLEYGDQKAVTWLQKHFTRLEIAEVLFHHRLVSPRSANFWAVVFRLRKERIPCLQKPYLEIRKKHWPY